MFGRNKIKLGDKVRDKVTGFEGVATAKIEFMNGCVRFCVTPKMKEDGKQPSGEYIDIEQLEVVNKEEVKVNPTPTGGGENPPAR